MSLLDDVVARSPSSGIYRRVFEDAPSALAVIEPGSPAPRIVRANAAFEALFGAKPGAIEGRRIDRVFRGAASRQVVDAVKQCLEHEDQARLRVADAPSGEVIRIDVQMRTIALPEGRRVVLGATVLKPMESLADVGEAGVLAELGALSRGLVFVCDLRTGRIRFAWHPLAERLGLLSAGSIAFDEVRKLVHPDDEGRLEAFAASQVKAGDQFVAHNPFRLRAADGRWLWIDFRSRVFARDLAGRVQRVIGVATDITAARNHAAALADAARALASAEQNERRRIGRELHDATSQFLVGARLNLGAVQRRLEPNAEVMSLLEEARASISNAEREIRSLSYFLHPPGLEHDGLQKALSEFASGFSGRTGLAISVHAAGETPSLSPATEMSLFRVAQEALMNVYRHADAKSVEIRLGREGRSFALEVEDDGVGLNGDGIVSRSGVGVPGMAARMGNLGGSFSLERGVKGVKVRALVPIARMGA